MWQVVVMGVSGCGKSTVGEHLAARLGARFVEGDTLHPVRNVLRMAAAIPLTDEDRWGWLDAVGRELARPGDGGVVASCSALKRAYRDRLRAAVPGVRFVYLAGTPELIGRRLAQRQHAYMPATLLPSQLAALEPPGPDEHAIELDIAEPPDALARRAHDLLIQGASPR